MKSMQSAFGLLIGSIQGLMLAAELLGIPRFSKAIREDLERVRNTTSLKVTEIVIAVFRFLYVWLLMVVVSIIALNLLSGSDPVRRMSVVRFWAIGFLMGLMLIGVLAAVETKTRGVKKP